VVSKKSNDEMSRDSDKFGDKKLDNGKPVPATLNEFTTPTIMLQTIPQIPQRYINYSVLNKLTFGVIRKCYWPQKIFRIRGHLIATSHQLFNIE
jgi:hypothetical protein